MKDARIKCIFYIYFMIEQKLREKFSLSQRADRPNEFRKVVCLFFNMIYMSASLLEYKIVLSKISLSIIPLIILIGCENANLIEDQIDKIDFKIVIFDENQKEGNAFEAGTDVRVALRIINSSGEDIQWDYDYSCLLLNTDDFLHVFKISGDNATAGAYTPIGTPYEPPVYCYAINLPPQNIVPGESVLMNIPWSTNPDNQLLSAGKYYTAASFQLTFNNQTRTWNLRTDFEVR